MKEPSHNLPSNDPIRIISARLPVDPVKKGDTVGDFGAEGFWILEATDGKLLPVTEISAEVFARVHRDWMQETKLHLFGQRRY